MVVTPGCTRIVRLRGSRSRIAFICARHMTIAPSLGTLPPLSPVPDPRVTIGTPAEAASFTHRETSSVVRGNTTAVGTMLERRGPVEAVRNHILRLRQHARGANDLLRPSRIEVERDMAFSP